VLFSLHVSLPHVHVETSVFHKIKVNIVQLVIKMKNIYIQIMLFFSLLSYW